MGLCKGDGVDDVSLIRRTRTIARRAVEGRRQPPAAGSDVQSGILPWRRNREGIDILLITSRGGNRWIIPKGWPMPLKTLRESACQEAFEEAGIRGQAQARPAGSFITDKTDFLGRTRQLEVIVYPMEVREELADWPEKGERQRRWCSPDQAADAVESDSLRELLVGFAQAARGGA